MSNVSTSAPLNASSSSTATSLTPSTSSSSTNPPYPDIQKGASLLLAYRLNSRPVLLIGGGTVASGRLFFLLESGAHITLISPSSTLDPSIRYRIDISNKDDITYIDKYYGGPNDDIVKVENFAMVLTAIDDNPLSQSICDDCRSKRVPVNIADVPPSCDFYFGAQMRKGPLQIMVSTGGMGPRIGALVRDTIRSALPDQLEEAIGGIGALRGELRKRAPGVGGELGQKRMDWMIGICDKWTLDEMVGFSDAGLRNRVLDLGWEKGQRIVGPGEVGVGGLRGKVRGWFEGVGGWGVWSAGLGGLMGGAAVGVLGTLYLVRTRR